MTILSQRLREIDYNTFERLCYALLKERHPGLDIRRVEGGSGDKGIDSFLGQLAGAPCIWQCKYFTHKLGESQRRQIQDSFDTAISNYSPAEWVLCVPIDLDVDSHAWLQGIASRLPNKVRIGLFSGSDIELELLYRPRVREYYFPNAILNVAEIKALLLGTGEYSDAELQKLTSENAHEFIRRLEQEDPRFYYRITLGGPSPATAETADARPPRGLLWSLTNEDQRIDMFAKDVEALRKDPPSFKVTLAGSALHKFDRALKLGTTEEFTEGEIKGIESTLPLAALDRQKPLKLVIGPSWSEQRSYRLTFSKGDESVEYEFVTMKASRVGTEELELVTVDESLPFRLTLILKFIERKANLTFDRQLVGRDVTAVQKMNQAMRLLCDGGEVALYSLDFGGRVGRFTNLTDAKTAGLFDPAFDALVKDLAEVSRAFGTPLRMPGDMTDEDFHTLSFLLTIARAGMINVNDAEWSFEYITQRANDARSFLSGEKVIRVRAPRLLPPPKLLGTEIDTGPVLFDAERAVILDADATLKAYQEAADGQAITVRIRALEPVQLTFLRFVPEPTLATSTQIRFLNTLTGRKEPFVPLHPPEVRIYTCGPTVYDFAHIGNFRTFVFQDILRRFLKHRGYRVIQVMNLTDVDDRIIENARAKGIGIREYTDKYIHAFLEDRRALSLEAPEHLIRATDHIDDMVALIQRLTEKGVTYKSDGSIYFRIAKFPNYGKLSKVDMSGIQAGARVESDRYEKADVRDFALWKAPKPGEHFWETPIGPGRPGWHIECSAMAMKYLGETLDMHTGGVDLAFPHHENEIAQSEAATGKPFVRYWLHAEHLNVEGEKMSKSLGNFFTLRELFEQGYKPSAIRFLLASVPYRSQLTFSKDALMQAQNSVEKLNEFVFRLETAQLAPGTQEAIRTRVHEAEESFERGMEDDLNTAVALAAVFNLVGDINPLIEDGTLFADDALAIKGFMNTFNSIFAVVTRRVGGQFTVDAVVVKEVSHGQDAVIDELLPEEKALFQERQAARLRRDFKRADEIRLQLAERGIILEDTRDGGIRWKRK